MKDNPNEFYIGWQAVAPDGISHLVRQFILAISILIPVVGYVLVVNQIGFSESAFEYGQVTEVEGTMTKTPAPFLQVLGGKDWKGESIYQNILLVAPGKHGVTEMLGALEKKLGHSVQGRMVKLKGYLIYYDGKTLMEVEDMSDITDQGAATVSLVEPLPYGQGSVIGEITDPKCFFGVMKPGYGKPHRSCAARCISGGIPPVLKTTSAEGGIYYYLVTGEDGEPINAEVLPFVGDQVAICGQIKKVGDWLVLYKDSEKEMVLMSDGLAEGMTMCK
ncbi:MAG TPA: hypothetical protein VI603_10850 [Saprospiraceae bacterium]|nr:hypothetical protein [Saprospiraceae bacterium]